MCIIYASLCATPILHTLITHMHAYIAQPIYRTHIHTYITYFTIHTYNTSMHTSHAYIPCIHHAYMHTNIHEYRCQTTTHGHSPVLSLTNLLALAYSKEQLVLRYVLPYDWQFSLASNGSLRVHAKYHLCNSTTPGCGGGEVHQFPCCKQLFERSWMCGVNAS